MENWQIILLLIGVFGLLILLFISVGVRWANLDESRWPGNSRLACTIREIKREIGDAKKLEKWPQKPEGPKKPERP